MSYQDRVEKAQSDHANQTRAIPEEPTLPSQALGIADLLSTIHNRVEKIGDILLGPIPREASGKDKPSPVPSLQLHLQHAHQFVGLISAALERIENRLESR